MWLLLVGVRFWVRVVIGLLFCSFGVRSCVRLCLVGVVRVYEPLVVVPVVAAGFAARARDPSFVGALAVPVCGAAVACGLVRSLIVARRGACCLHVWTRAGWGVLPVE